ncbi:unnamed protein product [Trichobilharzia regenti]|nr:unnamed protein product [Trichobilharzia regenti]
MPSRPIIYCSDGLCDLLRYTKGQLMFKSSALSVFYGPETTPGSMEALLASLNQPNETEICMNLYSRDSRFISFIWLLLDCVISFRIVVTPVRDENGGLPLYLLFFREEVSDAQTSHINKKSSKPVMDFRRHFKDRRSDTSDLKLNPIAGDSGPTETLACPQTLSTNEKTQFIEDCNAECVSVQSKGCRPVSLFLPKDQSDVSPRGLMQSKVDLSESRQGNPQRLEKSKHRPATWYRSHNEDENPEMIHSSTRSRHLHPASEESEALQLVLSSHAEPPKSSVTEKFAQFPDIIGSPIISYVVGRNYSVLEYYETLVRTNAYRKDAIL